ncbi:MAG: helix-turn-helix domain-containing protein [Clostridia bacterium]|nr:helix-turn-helix domain-containing protein [Clostridia bacterium]MBR6426749.1 helix-turn-helix domain-containing protein [Clostridia bacterium]
MKEAENMYNVMFSDYPEIVDVKQLQKMLGVSRHLVYELISDKKISAVKIGHSFRVPKINVIKYVLSGT